MIESQGAKWERERLERIDEIAPQLASIMRKDTSAYNWGDYIIRTRDMMWQDLKERNLLPITAELRCCSLKSLWIHAIKMLDEQRPKV